MAISAELNGHVVAESCQRLGCAWVDVGLQVYEGAMSGHDWPKYGRLVTTSKTDDQAAAVPETRRIKRDGMIAHMRFDNAPRSQAEKHAFISYVHEDSARVDDLEEALKAAGVKVWRDKNDLFPGSDWQTEIRTAITQGSLAFIACFSDATAARDTSYQFEELVLAVNEYRLRPPARSWLFPVRFSDVALPEYDLGAGRTLDSIHRTDFFGTEHLGGLVKLVNAVAQLVGPSPDSRDSQAAQTTARTLAQL